MLVLCRTACCGTYAQKIISDERTARSQGESRAQNKQATLVGRSARPPEPVLLNSITEQTYTPSTNKTKRTLHTRVHDHPTIPYPSPLSLGRRKTQSAHYASRSTTEAAPFHVTPETTPEPTIRQTPPFIADMGKDMGKDNLFLRVENGTPCLCLSRCSQSSIPEEEISWFDRTQKQLKLQQVQRQGEIDAVNLIGQWEEGGSFYCQVLGVSNLWLTVAMPSCFLRGKKRQSKRDIDKNQRSRLAHHEAGSSSLPTRHICVIQTPHTPKVHDN